MHEKKNTFKMSLGLHDIHIFLVITCMYSQIMRKNTHTVLEFRASYFQWRINH